MRFSNEQIIKNLKDHLLPCFHDLNEFEKLFPLDNELHYEMLDKVAPNFFLQLNKMYFDKFILSISRLLDSAKQGKFENLSMRQLIDVATNSGYPEVSTLKQKLNTLDLISKDIITLRNKHIAHRSLSHAINNDLKVGSIEFEKIKEIFKTMAECINELEKHLGLPQSVFIWLGDMYGITALLQNLKSSQIYRDIRIASENWQEDEIKAQSSKFYNLNC